jgi:hypothetical protein
MKQTDEQIYQAWITREKKLVDDAKADPKNIRYYLGKHRVCIIPSQKDSLYKGYRTVAALETFPHSGIQMMINEGEQFSSSTRHLQLKKCFSGKLTTEKLT